LNEQQIVKIIILTYKVNHLKDRLLFEPPRA
jgi:hypothetical protein